MVLSRARLTSQRKVEVMRDQRLILAGELVVHNPMRQLFEHLAQVPVLLPRLADEKVNSHDRLAFATRRLRVQIWLSPKTPESYDHLNRETISWIFLWETALSSHSCHLDY